MASMLNIVYRNTAHRRGWMAGANACRAPVIPLHGIVPENQGPPESAIFGNSLSASERWRVRKIAETVANLRTGAEAIGRRSRLALRSRSASAIHPRSASSRPAPPPWPPSSRHRRRRRRSRSSSRPSLATLAPRDSARALASLRVIVSSVPVKTTVLPAIGEPLVFGWTKSCDLQLASPGRPAPPDYASRRRRRRCRRRPTGRCPRCCRARGRRRLSGSCAAVMRLAPGRERAVVARQQPRRRLADLADAERIDEAFERDRAARLDGAQQLGDGLLAPALALLSSARFLREAEDVGRRLRPACRANSSSMLFSPSPSMSKALRLTKCRSRSTAWAAQIRPPVQRRTASPSSRTAWLLQTGQRSGKSNGLLPLAGASSARPRPPAGSRRRRAG